MVDRRGGKEEARGMRDGVKSIEVLGLVSTAVHRTCGAQAACTHACFGEANAQIFKLVESIAGKETLAESPRVPQVGAPFALYGQP